MHASVHQLYFCLYDVQSDEHSFYLPWSQHEGKAGRAVNNSVYFNLKGH